MRFLLDTHVLIWAWLEPERLPASFKEAVQVAPGETSISPASLWEMAIKQSMGKLKLPGPAADWVPLALRHFPFRILDITGRHALVAGSLPRVHNDPFDRMLIAQAREENLILVTSDPQLKRYDTPILTV